MSREGKGRSTGKRRSGTGNKGTGKRSTAKKGAAKKGTGRAARPAPAPAGGPSPVAVGGAAVVVLALLGLALAIAFQDPTPAASPSPEASVAVATPAPSLAATPAPTPEQPAVEDDDPADLEAMLRQAEPKTSRTPSPQETPAASPTPTADASAGEPASVAFSGETEEATVTRVIDGDTLDLSDGRRIRLLGINTPEIGRAYKKDAEKALRELTSSGTITLEYDGPKSKAKGRYGRTLAYIHCDGVFVNGEIVRRGLAYIYIYPNTKAHNDDLVRYQREARAAKRNLWSLPLPEPASLYIGNKRAPYFHREGCKRIRRLKGSSRVEFGSRNEALDAGMNPCQDCGS